VDWLHTGDSQLYSREFLIPFDALDVNTLDAGHRGQPFARGQVIFNSRPFIITGCSGHQR
jgi:hypothetical protein